jgi:hypothetical protein
LAEVTDLRLRREINKIKIRGRGSPALRFSQFPEVEVML